MKLVNLQQVLMLVRDLNVGLKWNSNANHCSEINRKVNLTLWIVKTSAAKVYKVINDIEAIVVAIYRRQQ